MPNGDIGRSIETSLNKTTNQLTHDNTMSVNMNKEVTENKAVQPLMELPSMKLIALGGDSHRHCMILNPAVDYKDMYRVIFFLPMTFTCDSSEMKSFHELYEDFKKENCQLIAVNSDNPLVNRRWLKKPAAFGGFQFGEDLKFPIICDHDLRLAKSLGAADTDKGIPCRAVYIVDWDGRIRHMSMTAHNICPNAKEVLRLVRAFREVDLTGTVVTLKKEDSQVLEENLTLDNSIGHDNKALEENPTLDNPIVPYQVIEDANKALEENTTLDNLSLIHI